ncbi:uncharacterized protein LOC135335855 isoform X4 [Halichondria panicea]|uniref:uncharacterized protein LOC135335855 isoform X4 n=1 Tax=Halichondria panicea TaxID=6063 RepID=UPI00312BC5D4
MSDNLAEQLYWASSDGRDQEVLELLQKGAPPNNSHYYSEQGGGTPLHRACANNHIRSADLLIKFGAIVAAKNNDGYIPLHWACVYNSMDTARLLLEHHCPTDIKDIIERTAADLAREYGYDALADYVEGFQPGPRDPLSSYPTLEQLSQLKCECDQWLLLGVCLGLVNDELETIKKSQHPTAETLKEAKIKNIGIQWKDIVEALVSIGEGKSALSVSAFCGWLDCVKHFVKTVGLDPKEPVNKAGDTPLSLASANGHLDTVKYLANEHHCDPRKPVNKAGDTPLSLACANGHLDTVKYLVNEHHCVPRSTVNKAGDTPLSLAYKGGHWEVVKYLAQEHQCDPKFAVNEAGDTPLSLECSRGDLEMVKALINKHVDTNKPVNKADDTPLSLACANGHLDTVKYLVNEHHCDPRKPVNKAGDTPLSLACANGHLDTVKYLVNEHHCVPRSTVNKAGDTPLSLAYKGGHWEVVKYLAQEHQCDPKFAVNEAGDTPLSLECSRGDLEMVKALINKHVDTNKPVNKADDTPLSLACANGHLDTVKYLVNEHHCDPSKPVNKAGDTPLSLACANGHLDTVKYLVNEHHCDPRKPVNKAGDTPLSLACANGHLDTVKYLVNKHHCVPRSTVNKAGDTPFSLAYKGGHWEVVKYLAQEHQCDPKFAVNEAGDTPLSLECSRGDLEMVKALINMRVDPNKPVNKAGDTSLSLAYQGGHWEVVKYLAITHHCDTTIAVNEAGDTPLSLECSRGDLEMVKALMNKRVDPNKPVNKAGDTPLSLTCTNGHLNTVKYLVNEHHCDIRSTVNKAGDTPLSLTCTNGHLNTVKYLVNEHHCDIRSTVNKAGDTPLSLAYKGGHWEVAKYLVIIHHCDTKSAVNEAGDTPLSLECSRGDLEMVKALMNKDVDPNSTNKAGDTPLSLAYKGGHWEVAKYLVITHHCDTKFAVNKAGDTPLSLECSRGDLEMVKALINKHVDPNEPVNKAGDTPLSLAYKGRHWEVVKYLAITHHCDPKIAVNEAGDTPLSLECSRGDLKMVKALMNKDVDPNKPVNKAGDTPLSLAYKGGHWKLAKYFVITHHCGIKIAVNKAGDTPLSLECSRGDLKMVKALIKNIHIDPNEPVNKAGDTPLSLAYKGRHWKLVKYLVITHHCHTKIAVNEAGDTPLSLECSRGDLEMVKALINKDVDPNKPVNKAGDTPLSLAYNGRHWEVAKYLVITHHCDTEFAVNEAGDTPLSLEFSRGDLEMVKALMNKDVDPNSFLLLAVKYGPASRVEFLLAECHSDPNVIDKEGKTPLDLSNDPNIIKLLLKHGAKVANVYKEHSKLIGKLSSERPPHLPLFVLLTGDGGVGKSTLLKSILTPKGFWSKLLQKARPVDGVDTRTVGIIPYEVYTKEFGRIIYFDFAGQKEFYTSHCAILENAVQTSPPIIILCAKLVESEQAIIDSMIHWLTLVQNQCTNLKDKAHVIVVGSHADQVKEMGEDPRAKESIFAPIIKQFPKFEFTEFIPMDCRFADSVDMKKAKRQIQKSSAILRSPETISLNAHTFYIYLVESFKDDLALLLGKVHEKIKSDLNEDLSKRTQDILSFIPSTISHLVEICDQLHKRGLLLFLRNDSSPEKSFLVIDQATLLSTVTGTVFAPESFRQHCKLASSTGVVPLSKFSKAFNGFDIEMLIAFMSHLELCFEIIDKKVLDFISKEIASSTDRDASVSESDTRYLFFPGLIRIETPDQVWKHAQSIKYHFGWIFETSQDTEFYDPRCLQVLILRIVFTFRLAPARKILLNIPSLQRFCSVWKSGICWCNDDGITAHLELAENGRSLVIKMRSDTVRPEGLIHRSRIVSTIRETVESFGRNVNVIESIIDPNEVVKHPLKNSSDLPLVDIKDIAAAVSSNKSTIKSTQQVGLTFEHLFQFEPYAGLDQATIQCIHSNKNVKKNEKISRAFISHFAELVANSDNETPDQVARNSRMYRRILSQFQALVVNIQSVSPRQEVVQALERWRSETEGTYSCLRDTLNKYSVFTGRNPLDLAGVAHDDIDLSVFRSSASRDEQYDPGTTSLHELMVKHRVTDEQLDREIKQDDFAPVAMHFDDVELYLNPLKLTDNEQADVRRETYLSRSNQVAVINCLSIWRGHEPSEATFRALIRILLDLRKAEIATKIVQYLNEIKAQ